MPWLCYLKKMSTKKSTWLQQKQWHLNDVQQNQVAFKQFSRLEMMRSVYNMFSLFCVMNWRVAMLSSSCWYLLDSATPSGREDMFTFDLMSKLYKNIGTTLALPTRETRIFADFVALHVASAESGRKCQPSANIDLNCLNWSYSPSKLTRQEVVAKEALHWSRNWPNILTRWRIFCWQKAICIFFLRKSSSKFLIATNFSFLFVADFRLHWEALHACTHPWDIWRHPPCSLGNKRIDSASSWVAEQLWCCCCCFRKDEADVTCHLFKDSSPSLVSTSVYLSRVLSAFNIPADCLWT